MERTHFGYRELYVFLQKHFPDEKLFTCKMIYNLHKQEFGEELQTQDNMGATISNLVAKKMCGRSPDISEDGYVQYYFRKDAAPLPPARPVSAKRSMPSSGPVERLTADKILAIIDEHFPNNQIFTLDDLKDKGNIDSTSIRTTINRLVKRKALELMAKRAHHGQYMFRRSLPKEPVPAPEKGTTPEAESTPENDVRVIDDESGDDDKPSKYELTEDIMRLLHIPFDILGEAVYSRILELKRQVIHVEEELGKRDRHIEALQKRVYELNKQNENLNLHISRINLESRKPQRKDAIATLGQVAKFSTLKRT